MDNVVDKVNKIKLVDFGFLYYKSAKGKPSEVVFLSFDGNVLGIIVDKIVIVKKIDKISAYNNEKNMLEYISGSFKLSGFEDCYLIDIKKLFEVAYEK
ncbi:MAG: chemotaxis protein CheW [Calditerrivibrio sp.]|nr:chemotaxis protein CheW [Calditerrivibrio sp.]MCA1932245.1 chemotaxis protein CheW [Calditerrivibrio sp.]MCA1981151.1 chemotaxis protein CheW [Calditerrivibrio sp.]